MTALDGVLFLAAVTSRSKAYAQAMSHHGLKPGYTLIFGNTSKDRPQGPIPAKSAAASTNLFLPNLSLPLVDTCKQAGWNFDFLACSNVNDPKVLSCVADTRPDYVIYSGYGGQLVRSGLLGLGIPFLHLHSGWLPDYCGSTTLYYSWLRENRCAVTAFFLDEKIDNGPVIARQWYPPPPPNLEIDNLYDGAIRADLLVQTLRDLVARGSISFSPIAGKRQVYYVIHPVLKNLAVARHDGK